MQVPIAYDEEQMRCWLENLRSGSIGRDDLVALGRRLADCLIPPGPVRDLYQRSLGMVEARGLCLRLRLRISPPELAALPWEYTYDEGTGDFLAFNPRTVLVRYHSQPVAPYSVTSQTPVPILVLISNAADARPLDAVKETRNLIEALSRLLGTDGVRIDVLLSGSPEERLEIEALAADRAEVRTLPGPASVHALRDALRQGERVVHYIGHGVFDNQAGGALLLVDDEGNGTLIGAQTLAREFRGTNAAVVVLNACQSATESTARSFMGIAPNLVRAGVPAVVAMQYAIRDRSAMSFSRALYEALADGWPLDAAVTEGRKAISAQVTAGDVDWGVPVLFMRSSDGVLWREEMGETDEEGGGGLPHVSAEAYRDAVGRDKIGHGDEGRGDKIEGRVGDVGPGAQVAIGKQITQVMTRDPAVLSLGDRAEIERLLADLKSQLVRLDIPEAKKLVGQEFVGQLEQELTKTEEAPDASTIKVGGDWLLKNIPALAGTIATIFLNPVVGKVVEAAGDIAAEWVKKRFGGGT
jgi:hypothetical protein